MVDAVGRIAHLLRRATFGPTAAEVAAAEEAGPLATLEALLAPSAPDRGAAATPLPDLGVDPYAQLPATASREDRIRAQAQRRVLQRALLSWWLDRMVEADHQLVEKLVFFWHGHWATSIQKVRGAPMMLGQLETFRRYGRGDYAPFARAMVRDPSLILWLDGQRNTREAPNENLARELMELFTLGIGQYTESDVKEGARALTGWAINRVKSTSVFVRKRHDPGRKTILGVTANHDADSFLDVLLRQRAHGSFLAGRLWFRFASDAPMPANTRDRLVAAYGSRRNVTALLRAMFADQAFAATTGQLVKQPIEWLVGALRQLHIRPRTMPERERTALVNGLGGLDQVPLQPPSVGGWPSGAAWLTTSSAQARLRIAELLATRARTDVLDELAAVPTGQRPHELARLLVVDAWTDRTRSALDTVVNQPRRLIALGLASPEYTVS
jgi:uncharacterized protein (DUF1800 family)